VVNFLPDDKADATDHVRTFASDVVLDIENLPPKTLVGFNAEEGLTYSDENGEVEDGIQGQLLELDPAGEKKAAEEFVH
jgi:hypothetical protein